MSLFARIYDAVMMFGEDGRVGELRRHVVSRARGRVIEIGAGTGLNFSHYDRGAQVVATDPDRGMLERARRRALNAQAEIVLVAARAGELPFRSGVFDESVIAFAMCTIPDPARALTEQQRVLIPGGALRMLEHVRVDRPAVAGIVQDLLTPLWRHVAKGCRLNRRTLDVVVHSGFVIDESTSHFGGCLRTILAHAPGPADNTKAAARRV